MIQAPVSNQVKFLIPELVDEIDPLAEPTVVNATAEDVLQDVIADDGVIVNAWDGRPYFRPKIHTGNRALNGGFDSDTDWSRGAGWTISAGKANKAGGTLTDLSQAGRLVIGVVYEVTFTVSGHSAGNVTAKAGTAAGSARGGNGTFIEDITCAGNTSIVFSGDAASVLSIDNVFYRPKSLWRIDTALQRRPEKSVDFAMVVTHNLHQVYQAACENVLRFFQNTADALPSDPLESTKTLYGLLGKPWPFISQDGINDLGTIPDNPDLDVGTGPFTLEALVRINAVGNLDTPISKKNSPSNNVAGYLFHLEDASPDKIVFKFANGSGNASARSSRDVDWTLGEWVHIFGGRNGNGESFIEVGGNETIGNTLTGNLDSVEPFNIGADGGPSDYTRQDVALVRLWNRFLSVSERAALVAGAPVAFADRGASQTELMPNQVDRDFSGPSAWQNLDWDSYSESGALQLQSNAADQLCTLPVASAPMTAGKKFRLYYDASSIAGSVTIQDFTGVQTFGTISANATQGFIEWTVDTGITGGYRVVAVTGATQIVLDNLSTVQIGAVLALEPDGINSVFGKWFDKANQHHATLTGVDYWHVPDADNPAFFFQAFDSFNSRYLFTQFNELLEAGQADTRLGWIIYGQQYGFRSAGSSGIALEQGGYQASKNWPGVRIGETDAGIILAEQKFGERPSWNITLLAQDTAGWESIQDMLQRIGGPLIPFYIIWDYSHKRPVIWQVRLDPEIPFTYVTGSDPWQGITFGLKAE